jgi:hypothetical protein
MKSRTLISLFTLALAAGSSACSTETASSPADEPTAKSDQSLITTTGNIMAWPLSPITWDGMVGTWPIALWSPATIGAVAFDITGMTNLGLTVVGFPGLTAIPITSAYLNAFIPPVGVAGAYGMPFLGAGGLYAPAYGYAGAYAPYAGLGYGFGAYGALGGIDGTFLNGAWTAGLGLLNPALTTNALMLTNMTALNAFTPFVLNVTFTAQTAAAQTALIAQSTALSTASLSLFATPILPGALAAQTAAIPFMSMVFPIMPLPLTTPLLTAPLATSAALL